MLSKNEYEKIMFSLFKKKNLIIKKYQKNYLLKNHNLKRYIILDI